MQTWKMNLIVVSERYRVVIIAVNSKLRVYELDPLSASIVSTTFYEIDMLNDGALINNLRLITCAEREFLVSVDDGAFVRMVYLDDLNKDPIKFRNIYSHTNDNSTWSVDGSSASQFGHPPRVVVGSNAHSLTIFNLKTGNSEKLPFAHSHNVPCVSFSPCGRFIASTSIDKSLKVWEATNDEGGKWRLSRLGVPDQEWGWAV
jgi:WD40 repeat protein